jgi:hypothetical protein
MRKQCFVMSAIGFVCMLGSDISTSPPNRASSPTSAPSSMPPTAAAAIGASALAAFSGTANACGFIGCIADRFVRGPGKSWRHS